ncbi:MAG: hypothetical protein QGG84_05275 [Rhodospirillales bacterium]|nr:hypothetical protein [Rhodospirillales bacterium]
MIEDVKSCQFTVTAEDGVNLSVVEKTNSEHGPPKILLVHGSGCGWEYWDVPLGTIFRGVMPFIVIDIVRLALLVLAPGFVMLLPNLMD